MLKKFSLAGVALAISASALVPVAPAAAQRYDRSYQNDAYRDAYRDGYDRDARNYRDDRRTYRDNRRYSARQRCDDGDGGTIIGAIAGGLLGRSVSGGGDHVLGTVLGAGAGALAGRAIDRSDRPNSCRR